MRLFALSRPLLVIAAIIAGLSVTSGLPGHHIGSDAGSGPGIPAATVESLPQQQVPSAGPAVSSHGPAVSSHGPAVSSHGMVSSAHPLATAAGVRVLDSGGNAFDAAVAVAFALGVVEPMMSGIAGYGTIMVYDAATGEALFLNPSARIPAGVDSDVFRPPTPDYRENRRGAKAVSTPGYLPALEAMWQRFGSQDWVDLLENAIVLADSGFILDTRIARLIGSAFQAFPPHAQEFYGRDGSPLQAGDRLVQKDLGRSLRLIAEQRAAAMHGGELGEAIDAVMRETGGFMTLDDLRAAEAEWWEPIGIDYRGYQVLTASPPANAFPALVRLGMMSRFDVAQLQHNSKAFLHTFAEVTKHAFWTRLRYAGDPDVNPPPLQRILSEEYWQEQVDLIDPNRATRFVPPDVVGESGDGNTTHFVVADEAGNVVSATLTLGNSFGSRIMPAGTGIWLNNSLAYCTFEPKGNPMDAHAGRRKLSGDVPMLIMKNGRVWAAIGTPGGHTIGQTVPQVAMNLIDFGMDVHAAIAAPRISFVEPDALSVESGIPERIRDELAAMGHNVRVRSAIGNAHGLTIQYDADGRPVRFTGGADVRGAGLARGPAVSQR